MLHEGNGPYNDWGGGGGGGRIRALNRMNKAHPFEQRAVMVALSADRARQQEYAKDQGGPQPERTALRKMMACTYLELRFECEEYREKRDNCRGH